MTGCRLPPIRCGRQRAGPGRRVRRAAARRGDPPGLAGHADTTGGGTLLNAGQRAELGRRVIQEALDAEAAQALEEGRPPPDPAAEQQAARSVFDALFGFGGFGLLLEDPRIENINAQGCDQVFIRYADGRRAKAATPQRHRAGGADPGDRRAGRVRGTPV